MISDKRIKELRAAITSRGDGYAILNGGVTITQEDLEAIRADPSIILIYSVPVWDSGNAQFSKPLTQADLEALKRDPLEFFFEKGKP